MTAQLSIPEKVSSPGIKWPAAIAWISLAGVALRCFAINKNGFWYDEAYTAMLTRFPLRALATAAAGDDGNPPLYWLIMRIWSSLFGGSETGSAVFP